MKCAAERPFADPDAARKLIEIANAVEPVQDGRIYIELINSPFLYQLKGTPAELQGRFRSARLPRAGFGCTRAAPAQAG